MGKAKTKTSSMRNTPTNKIRRINRDIEQCTTAMLGLEAQIETLEKSERLEDGDASMVPELRSRVSSLKSHIKGLEESKSAWAKGGPRASR